MATIKKMEDLICWQKARLLVKEVYTITRNNEFNKDYSLKDQIRRAAVSVMSNVAEGFERGTKIELINYFFIARGSAGEVRSQLYAAFDQKYINKMEFEKVYGIADEAGRLIISFVNKVKTNSKAGLQYYKPKDKNLLELEKQIGEMARRSRGF